MRFVWQTQWKIGENKMCSEIESSWFFLGLDRMLISAIWHFLTIWSCGCLWGPREQLHKFGYGTLWIHFHCADNSNAKIAVGGRWNVKVVEKEICHHNFLGVEILFMHEIVTLLRKSSINLSIERGWKVAMMRHRHDCHYQFFNKQSRIRRNNKLIAAADWLLSIEGENETVEVAVEMRKKKTSTILCLSRSHPSQSHRSGKCCVNINSELTGKVFSTGENVSMSMEWMRFTLIRKANNIDTWKSRIGYLIRFCKVNKAEEMELNNFCGNLDECLMECWVEFLNSQQDFYKIFQTHLNTFLLEINFDC